MKKKKQDPTTLHQSKLCTNTFIPLEKIFSEPTACNIFHTPGVNTLTLVNPLKIILEFKQQRFRRWNNWIEKKILSGFPLGSSLGLPAPNEIYININSPSSGPGTKQSSATRLHDKSSTSFKKKTRENQRKNTNFNPASWQSSVGKLRASRAKDKMLLLKGV